MSSRAGSRRSRRFVASRSRSPTRGAAAGRGARSPSACDPRRSEDPAAGEVIVELGPRIRLAAAPVEAGRDAAVLVGRREQRLMQLVLEQHRDRRDIRASRGSGSSCAPSRARPAGAPWCARPARPRTTLEDLRPRRSRSAPPLGRPRSLAREPVAAEVHLDVVVRHALGVPTRLHDTLARAARARSQKRCTAAMSWVTNRIVFPRPSDR